MTNKNIKNKTYQKTISQNNISPETIVLLKNRYELLIKKNKNMSIKKDIKTMKCKKVDFESKNFFYKLNIFKDTNNIKILKKIKEIDPWYAKICQLNKLSKIAEQLAINTFFKNTLSCWYLYLINTNNHLIKHNAWTILKENLHSITKKRVKLIIKKKDVQDRLTPYQWFKKIYTEKISKEYLLLINDPNVQFLKKQFDIECQQKNIDFI
ncbi:DNA polymerase III subunit gamma/tau C-terminal domain-containing protein [Buchnera aphidicola]|uniref:DNA polymerase III subunit gamma/tau C-terminal domain-containing protein n=1 Tax=Buchnera aphidicola TaxID=9 RepID=UPI0034641934